MSEDSNEPFTLNPIEDLAIGDWRIDNVLRLGVDIPEAFSGGPSHRAGEPAYSCTNVTVKDGTRIGFTIPNSTALALSIAWRASSQANSLRNKIKYKDVLTAEGSGKGVEDESTPVLFDYFEKCMIVVTFSFQALEVFSNQIISNWGDKGALEIERKGKKVLLSRNEIERKASTTEKLGTILPKIMDIDTPKGTKLWENFVKLRKARDSTIHLKYSDQFPDSDESLFYQFLSYEMKEFPNNSAHLIGHFCQKGAPRWAKVIDHRNKKAQEHAN